MASLGQLTAGIAHEHWCKIAGRGIDDLQDLGGRGLPLQRVGKFRFTLGKLTFQIGDDLLRIG
jgi:hypothetical protein